MKKKNYLLLLFIIFCSLISRTYALTIRETMDNNDEYSTLEEGSVIIGVTRFSPNNIVTASKAATAGADDAMLYLLQNGSSSGYKAPGVYYYVDSYVGWFYLDSENKVTTVTDETELEKLSKLDIYYVDNEEKILEIDYPNQDINESTLPEGVTYKDNKLYVNATVQKIEFKTIDEKKISFIMDTTTSQFIEDIRSCYTINNNTITDYNPECGNDIVIPTEINGITITTIGANAFKNTNLVSVVIPNTITSIGDNAFANNDLEKVVIKDKYDQTEFSNYGDNVFGNFDNIVYDNELTRIMNYVDSDFVIKHYKTFDTEFFLDSDEYILSGYVVNNLITKFKNNGYSKNYKECGSSCDYYYEESDGKSQDIYGISYENLDTLKYEIAIHNYDNNKINKVSKVIDVSFLEVGDKKDSEIVLEAMKNLKLDHRYDGYSTVNYRMTRRKNIQDLIDLYDIEVVLDMMGCGAGNPEGDGPSFTTCSFNTYYQKDDVLYQEEHIFINGVEPYVCVPTEKLEDYDNIDDYVDHILNLFPETSGVTNYEVKTNDDGLPYKIDEQYYNSYETAKSYVIEIFDKDYLETWKIYFLDFYEDQYDSNGYTKEECFEVSNGVITDYDGTCGINVRIPDTINGMDITEISNSIFQYMKLNSVRLPNKLQKIGSYTFENNALTSIEFPNTLTTIGNNAFSMNLLTDVKIPILVEVINYGAFSSNNIENIRFENNITTIDDYAFSNNKIKQLEIPSSISSIGNSAFSNNEIETLNLSEGLEKIGQQAFQHNKIKELQLPSTLQFLESGAFSDNQLSDEDAFVYSRKQNENGPGYVPDYESLNSYGGQNRESVVIPKEVLFIGNYAFHECDIKKVNLSKSVLQIGSYAFASNELTTIDIPYGINLIGDNAFAYNNLTFVVVPDSAVNRGWSIFEGNLFEGENSFIYTKDENNKMDYTNLIGYYNNQYEIKELIIPSTVKKIGNSAFSYGDIKKLVIPYGVEEIGDAAFRNTSIKEISIPKSVKKIGRNAFGTYYSLSKENGYVYATNEDGTIDKTILMAYIANINDGSLTIPEGIEEIRENIFYNKYSLNEVILPNSLKKIGDNAFKSTNNLTKVTFNENLESIGEYAFANTRLSDVTLGNKLQNIEKSAFENINTLKTVIIGDGPTIIGDRAFYNNYQTTSISLGNNVESIGEYAFYGNRITEINIPSTVKTIGDHAFSQTYLNRITLNEGLEKIGNNAFYVATGIPHITIPASVTDIGNDAFGWNVTRADILGKSSEEDFESLGTQPFGNAQTITYELSKPQLLPTLQLPTLPININSYNYLSSELELIVKITDIQYLFESNTDGTFKLTLFVSGTKTYDILGDESLKTGTAMFYLNSTNDKIDVHPISSSLPGISVGNSFINYEIIFDNLPRADFTLEVK